MPKYGGFCAFGIAHDGKYDIDPVDFLIDIGEFLFCPNQIESWKKDQENLKKKANDFWVEMEKYLKEKI